MTRIVVGVDGSEGATQALVWAMQEAQLRQLPLTAVLVWGLLDQHRPDGDDSFDPNYGEADARAALDAYVVRAVGEHQARVVERQVTCDLPAAGLLAAAGDASLLVVGARGLGGFGGLLLGSVSQHCLHHATCPVAVVRPDGGPCDGTAERIVVGIDGSETARRALRWATEEAVLRQASLEVVHTWHLPHVGSDPLAAGGVDPTVFAEGAGQTLDAALAGIDTTGLERPVERVLSFGGPAPAILDASKGADLVVLGSRGLGGFVGLVLGSVSAQVARHATCPVVVIPPER